MKTVIKPTYEQLEKQLKELQTELDGRPELTFHPMQRINSLRTYIDEPTPENMFQVGLEYEKMGQTASAIGFFHQCAERALHNDELGYEALLRMSLCYQKQGGRKAHEKIALSHAISLLPDRPEAYYLMSSVCERQGREDNFVRWFDAYMFACIGEEMGLNDGDEIPLSTDVDYFGTQACTFQKAVTLWWTGRGDDARQLFKELSKRDDFPTNIKTIIDNNLLNISSNAGRQEE